MPNLTRFVAFCALSCLLAVASSRPLAAATSPSPEAASTRDSSPARAITATIATVTGIAISPLLGTAGYGAYQWISADNEEQRARLPWYAKLNFWLPALVVVGLVACKDMLGAALPPGFKKPLDVLETIENKCSGLVAAGAVVPFTLDALSKLLLSGGGTQAMVPAVDAGGLAMLQLGAIDFSWGLNLLTVPFGIAVFLFVWMSSHAINVLILLSPWGAIDAALKGARAALLGLLTLSATINPWVGGALSLAIIVLSWLVAGWAFRLMIFGTLFSWDFFTLRKRRFKVDPVNNRVFSGGRLCAQNVPIRTYGRWINEPENGRWRFVYKPWLVMPEQVVDIPATAPHVGKGLFISTLRDGDNTLLILPPRYRDHEQELVHAYKVEGGIQNVGLLKAWRMLRELFGGGATQTQVV